LPFNVQINDRCGRREYRVQLIKGAMAARGEELVHPHTMTLDEADSDVLAFIRD
jgi:hypothetical protein